MTARRGVILATRRPGQRDQWHSHPALGVYFLTDCEPRVYTPDGQFVDTSRKGGVAGVRWRFRRTRSKVDRV
jgi:hypothetical protein